MTVVAITSIAQLTTMTVITFTDINGKENVIAASILSTALLGAFKIIGIVTNVQYLVADMDHEIRVTAYGNGVSKIPFGVLKLIFSALFLLFALMHLQSNYDIF